MKQTRTTIMLSVLLLSLLAVSCKKKVDDMKFSGRVVGYTECTANIGLSISDMDWGFYVALSSPAGVGGQLGNDTNVVVLYGTKTRLSEGAHISGRLYFDEDYDDSYCNLRNHTGLPEAVCSELD